MIRQVQKNHFKLTVQGNEEFWDSFQSGEWESNTIQILTQYLRPEDTMLDIGAWIGPISLYSGCIVKKCFSFEPDPIAFSEFTANLKLNPALESVIVPFQMAITKTGKPIKLFARHAHGDSGSSILKRVKSRNDYFEVKSTTFANVVSMNQLNKIDFIKMDIEGGEFVILPEMQDYLKKHKPTLLISFHHSALMEFYESKYLPFGIFRRVYRFLDKNRTLLKSSVDKKMLALIESMSFYSHILNENLQPANIQTLKKNGLGKIDMLLFSTRNPDTDKSPATA